MNKLTILMGVLLAGSYALAQDTDSSVDPYSGSSLSGKAPAAVRSDSSSQTLETTNGKVTAEVIAADEMSKTITVRPMAGGSSSASAYPPSSVTLPVEGKAVASLKSVKSGEHVSLTCRSSQMGTSTSDGSTTGNTGTITGSSTASCNSVTQISKAKATTPD
jgi:hypothetical protein